MKNKPTIIGMIEKIVKLYIEEYNDISSVLLKYIEIEKNKIISQIIIPKEMEYQNIVLNVETKQTTDLRILRVGLQQKCVDEITKLLPTLFSIAYDNNSMRFMSDKLYELSPSERFIQHLKESKIDEEIIDNILLLL